MEFIERHPGFTPLGCYLEMILPQFAGCISCFKRPLQKLHQIGDLLDSKLVTILFEPFPLHTVIRTYLFQIAPKIGCVTVDFQVSQLVKDNIVDHIQWNHYEAIWETQCPSAATRAPTSVGTRDADIFIIEPMVGGKRCNFMRNHLAGLSAVPICDYLRRLLPILEFNLETIFNQEAFILPTDEF